MVLFTAAISFVEEAKEEKRLFLKRQFRERNNP
jgi:hypothetical protein